MVKSVRIFCTQALKATSSQKTLACNMHTINKNKLKMQISNHNKII